MTQRTIYECDGCGEQFGHKTELQPVPIRHKSSEWAAPTEETLHACIDCGAVSIGDVLQSWDRFLVIGRLKGEVTGLQTEDGAILMRGDASVEEHGNMAIIEDAMDSVGELV